jgi:tetratricopeptide (TPR) repeat protein
VRCWTFGLLLVSVVPSTAAAAAGPGSAADALDQAMADGESRLQAGDLVAAESRYRDALFEGWLLTGALERLERRSDAARQAYSTASSFAAQPPALRSLASAYLQLGDAARAAEILTGLARADPKDVPGRRLLAQALTAAGQLERAAQALAEAVAAEPGDPEVTFVLATDYLWLKRVDDAERLFAQLLKARPLPQTHVLIGHAYRDAGEYEHARRELRAALAQDPKVRRAHYTLATVILADAALGPERRQQAVLEFREELKLPPDDAQTCDALGVELLDAGQAAEALTFFERAVRAEERALYVSHLGRGLLALDRPAEAAAALRRALELAQEQRAGDAELENMHYQLGLAARKTGAAEEAARHFGEARRIAARWTESPRKDPAAQASDATAHQPTAAAAEESPLAALAPEARADLARRVRSVVTQAYLNLGVIQAQGEHFDRAAELFESAADLDPDFPKLQYSLGVARFKAQQFEKATGPLSRALAQSPDDRWLRRTLALAWLSSHAYEKAAELLQDDPERRTDPGLEFSYGLALAHSNRKAEALLVFETLRARHGASPELEAALRALEEKQ